MLPTYESTTYTYANATFLIYANVTILIFLIYKVGHLHRRALSREVVI